MLGRYDDEANSSSWASGTSDDEAWAFIMHGILARPNCNLRGGAPKPRPRSVAIRKSDTVLVHARPDVK